MGPPCQYGCAPAYTRPAWWATTGCIACQGSGASGVLAWGLSDPGVDIGVHRTWGAGNKGRWGKGSQGPRVQGARHRQHRRLGQCGGQGGAGCLRWSGRARPGPGEGGWAVGRLGQNTAHPAPSLRSPTVPAKSAALDRGLGFVYALAGGSNGPLQAWVLELGKSVHAVHHQALRAGGGIVSNFWCH